MRQVRVLISAFALSSLVSISLDDALANPVPAVHAQWSRIFVIISAGRRCNDQSKEDLDLQLVLLGYPLSSHAYYEREMKDEIQEIFDKNPNFCADSGQSTKKILNTSSSSTRSTISDASTRSRDDEVHKLCLDARDYEGCIRVKKGLSAKLESNSNGNEDEKCFDQGWCIAKKGRDRFGLKKLTGWIYKEFTDGDVLYVNPNTKRVPHSNDRYRYLVQEQVYRFYRPPTTGSDPVTTTIGSSTITTTCTGYVDSVQCRTSEPLTLTRPGSRPRPGMNISRQQALVVDCKDKTQALYINGGLKGNWSKVKEQNLLLDQCSDIKNLGASQMKL